MKKTSLSKKDLKRLWDAMGKLLDTLASTDVDEYSSLIKNFVGGQEMLPVLHYLQKVDKNNLPPNATLLVYGCGCFILSKAAGQILHDNKKLSKDDQAYLKDYIEYNVRKCRIDISLFHYLEHGEWLWD